MSGSFFEHPNFKEWIDEETEEEYHSTYAILVLQNSQKRSAWSSKPMETFWFAVLLLQKREGF